MHHTTYHGVGQKAFGPWGQHTSSIDWCEDNYVHSDYLAETWNTVSSIAYALVGVQGMLMSKGTPFAARAMMSYFWLVVIGLGSALFHATLLIEAQIVFDELPMIWSACAFVYDCVVAGDQHGSTPLMILMTFIGAFISIAYVAYPNPIGHQIAFGILQFTWLGIFIRRLKRLDTSTPDRLARKKACIRTATSGVASFVLGFVIWNLDNIFCEQITQFREGKGEIFNAITQGHAWWHLLTCIGAARFIGAVFYLSVALIEPDGWTLTGLLLPTLNKIEPRNKNE